MNNQSLNLNKTQQTRFFAITTDEVQNDTRTIEASLSSELPVERYYGKEVLIHTPEAVDLSRTVDGLPLLWNHNSDIPIGLVENVRLVDNKLRGTLRFSNNNKANEVLTDVKDGFLRNISVGYNVHDWIEEKDTVSVTRWSLVECSIAPVPADPSVGINRSFQFDREQSTMNVNEQESEAIKPKGGDLPKIRRELDIIRQEARQVAVHEERQRVGDVNEIFENKIVPQSAEFRALRMQALDEGWTVDLTRLGSLIKPASLITSINLCHTGSLNWCL